MSVLVTQPAGECICCRGFLKSDKQLGVVNIKLQPLEDRCIFHDSYDVRRLIVSSWFLAYRT